MNYYVFTLLTLFPFLANAYLGPGLGLGTLGVFIGFIMSILLAIIAIFWYPIKRLFKKNNKSKKTKNKVSKK